jgi:hypothetical protein
MVSIETTGRYLAHETINRPASPEREVSGTKSGYLRSFDSEAQALTFARSWAKKWSDTYWSWLPLDRDWHPLVTPAAGSAVITSDVPAGHGPLNPKHVQRFADRSIASPPLRAPRSS